MSNNLGCSVSSLGERIPLSSEFLTCSISAKYLSAFIAELYDYKVDAAASSKMFVMLHQVAWHRILEDLD
jgi:hypothetical protein